ncbi:DUF58 domain-containing protein [Flavonifractor plautii]|uniref:DUF58 domain-containing protein n=1 Tax=Candidatus Flavonifractor intestinigallinarum TaxID=2838586 RepID=A0A9D2SAE9_9FIRM|nr:DUF58 domain-containing protein [Flavonifractor plautii]MBM6664527.1 DUF58 domain-containing protein [Flavonifractor plautii]HJB80508.1 DUF58 domain-containing protein [Candidatus Flavonifractor intestinigallinarum]
MAARRILYAVLVGMAVLFQIFFRFYLSTFVLVLILVLPILSLLLALPGWMGSMASAVPEASLVTVGGSARFRIILYHSSFLPLIRPRVRLGWTNQLTGESGESKLTLTARKPAELTVPAAHCGRLVCRVEGAVCCDLLGLFPLPVRKGPERAVLILPVHLELEGKEELAAGENAGTVLRPRPGGGPGEDYDLREYRVGDPLRSVHWKLSSKKDELVVRETLEPQQAAIVVTYDHFGPPEDLDRTFAQLWALSRWLLQQDRPHHIQWASPLTGVAEDRAVDSPNALLACLDGAFSTPAPLEGRSILDGALRLPGGGKVRHLHVTPEGVEGGGR